MVQHSIFIFTIILATFVIFIENAHANLTTNINITSNYVWRGVTQIADNAAFQTSMHYIHNKRFYIGTFASNINWFGGDSGIEKRINGGLIGRMGYLNYNVGLMRYIYTGSGYENSNFLETVAKFNYKNIEFGINYTINGESRGYWNKGDLYYLGGLSLDFLEDWNLNVMLGYYDFYTGNGAGDYVHGQIDLSKDIGRLGNLRLSLSVAEKSDTASNKPVIFISWLKVF